ncbi:hypothetical protein [Enterococcus olivae]
MERIKYSNAEGTLEELILNLENQSLAEKASMINITNNTQVGIREDKHSEIKVMIQLSLFDGEAEDAFLFVKYSSVFDTDNQLESFEGEDPEKVVDLINFVMSEISEVITFVTSKALPKPVEIPKEI